MVYKYEGYFHDGECWLALIGGTEYTRNDLEKVDPAVEGTEQMAEIAKALAELPDDMTPPKRGQRRKIIPAEGELED